MATAPVFMPLKHHYTIKSKPWRQSTITYQLVDAAEWVPVNLSAGGRLTIRRNAGLGDCLMIACVIARLKQQRPDLHVRFAIPEAYTELLSRFVEVDEAVSLPDAEIGGQSILELSNYVERHPQTCHIDRTTLFAQALGIAGGKLPTYRPQAADIARAKGVLGGRRPVAICMRGTYPHRSWLIPRALRLAQQLEADEIDIILFDAKQEPPFASWIAEGLKATKAFGLPLTTVAAVLSRCLGVVSPDTGLLHLCGCLQVPFVGILGAIEPRLRTALYQKHIDLIARQLPCCPCFENNKHITCSLECLQAIDVQTVSGAVHELLDD